MSEVLKIKDYVKGNTGVILEPLKPEDLLFGNNVRGIEHNITLDDRNWYDYYSVGELQLGTYYDTASCVTFSALNILEAKFNYLIETNQISTANIEWLREKGYLNENGRVDFSDRFTAAMSGTTDKGNTGGKVWWSIRNHGVVPESAWAWDRGRDVPYEERFADWYRDKDLIPQEVKDLGKEFTERFEIFYEHVRIRDDRAELYEALKHSPVHVYIPTSCPYDEDRVQQYCDGNIGHAVSLIDDTDPRGYLPLFDHYLKQPQEEGNERYIRRVVENYKFYPYGYVCTINQKNMDNDFVKIIKDKNSSAVGIWLPFTKPETLENMALHYNKKVPKTDEGGIDWSELIEGELELK